MKGRLVETQHQPCSILLTADGELSEENPNYIHIFKGYALRQLGKYSLDSSLREPKKSCEIKQEPHFAKTSKCQTEVSAVKE